MSRERRSVRGSSRDSRALGAIYFVYAHIGRSVCYLCAFMPVGLSGEDRSHDGGTGPAPGTGTVIVIMYRIESGETGMQGDTGDTGDRRDKRESERYSSSCDIGRRNIVLALTVKAAPSRHGARGSVTPVTGPRESREHVRTVPASRRDLPIYLR